MMQILFATDFSEPAEAAATLAADYARSFGARLHLLHVVPPVTDAVTVPRLERLARGIGVKPTVTAVRSGIAAAEIVRYAAENDADLIVVGTHGRTGLSRALVGSVSERVVRTAPCPVLSVPLRRHGHGEGNGAAEPLSHRCIVCAEASDDLICERCRARIRGEVLERKQREEREERAGRM